VIAAIRPIIRSNNETFLRPDRAEIGTLGNRDAVRMLPGGVAEAQQLFNNLTRFGSRPYLVPRGQYSTGGTFVELPGGGTIGFRINSDGLPTVDVNVPGMPKVRYHFK